MKRTCSSVELLEPVSVHFYSESGGQNWRACYGSNSLKFAKGECGGNRFFDGGLNAHRQQRVELLIHEYAHDSVSDHLSSDFYDECCRLGAKYITYLANRGVRQCRPRVLQGGGMSIKTKQERIWGNHAVIGVTIEMRVNDIETGAHGI